jgi:hypothetical protein
MPAPAIVCAAEPPMLLAMVTRNDENAYHLSPFWSWQGIMPFMKARTDERRCFPSTQTNISCRGWPPGEERRFLFRMMGGM